MVTIKVSTDFLKQLANAVEEFFAINGHVSTEFNHVVVSSKLLFKARSPMKNYSTNSIKAEKLFKKF